MQAALAGGYDAFVTKLSPSGTALVYSTYLGGSSNDEGYGIAVDSAGSAYVTGQTFSSNFPTASPLQAANAGEYDAFVAKLNPAGSALVYSTYLGGSAFDSGSGIAVDSAGSAYVTGQTNSSNFPTASPLQAANAGGSDAFVAKLNPAGSALVYSTYLGGSSKDFGNGIAVDSAGSASIVGSTSSTNFPTAVPLQAANASASGDNAFVAKLNPAGSALIYSTYLGGSNYDDGNGIAVDAAGSAYVTGYTGSTNFPTASPLQAHNAGPEGTDEAFVAKLSPLGASLVYSTYLGGSVGNSGRGIAVDSAGNAYVTGGTGATDFPTVSPPQAANGGGYDAFVAKIATHLWQGTDVAVGSDNRSRLLWGTADGRGDVWAVTGANNPTPGPSFGPVAGWSVKAVASGSSDGLTHLLWTAPGGNAALWLLRSDGSLQSSAVFGPVGAAWQAQDVAVGSDNKTYILWFNSTFGKMVVWTVSSDFTVSGGPFYGPGGGWSAVRLDAGGDGLLRVLWTNTNGTAAVWTLDDSGVFQSQGIYGPISGWTAVDVTVGSDNLTRILWANASANAAAIWKLYSSLGVSSTSVYGGASLPGWQVEALDAGSDGLLRVEWNRADGTAALWLVNADGTFNSAGAFGPF